MSKSKLSVEKTPQTQQANPSHKALQPQKHKKMKVILGQYLRQKTECEYLYEKIRSKREDMQTLKAVTADSVARHGNEVSDYVEKAIEQIDGLITYYAKMVVQREESERQVLSMIERISDSDAYLVIYLHYIQGVSFEEIPQRLLISQRSMWNRYRNALDFLCADPDNTAD